MTANHSVDVLIRSCEENYEDIVREAKKQQEKQGKRIHFERFEELLINQLFKIKKFKYTNKYMVKLTEIMKLLGYRELYEKRVKRLKNKLNNMDKAKKKEKKAKSRRNDTTVDNSPTHYLSEFYEQPLDYFLEDPVLALMNQSLNKNQETEQDEMTEDVSYFFCDNPTFNEY